MIESLLALPLLFSGSNAYIVRMESSQEPEHYFRLAYPLTALQANAEGDAKFEIWVDKEGRPVNCKITLSSGHPALDAETCKLMMTQGKWRPMRTPEGDPKEFAYSDTAQWRLDPSTTPTPQTRYRQDDEYPPAALALGLRAYQRSNWQSTQRARQNPANYFSRQAIPTSIKRHATS